MADFSSVGRSQARTTRVTTNFFQRSADSFRITSELHCGSISQKFALPADSRLDEIAKKSTTITHHQKANSKQQQTSLAVFSIPHAVRVLAAAQHVVTDHADDSYA